MHELTVVQQIVKIADETVLREQASKVLNITLEIGECSGIEMSAFDFAWPIAVRDSLLEFTDLKVIHRKARAKCGQCSTSFTKRRPYDPCPQCGSFIHHLYEGNELKIKSMNII